MNLLFGAVAMLLGVLLTTQVGTNTMLGKTLDNPYFSAAMNMLTGLALTCLLVLIVSKPFPSAAVAQSVPWWNWVAGGMLGTTYLVGNILLAPKLGAAALVACVVTGQVLFALATDHFGWLGFEQHSINPGRVAGGLMIIGGLALVARF